MKIDGAITCKYASTFCVPNEVHIICKNTLKGCIQTVEENACTGKLKAEDKEEIVE